MQPAASSTFKHLLRPVTSLCARQMSAIATGSVLAVHTPKAHGERAIRALLAAKPPTSPAEVRLVSMNQALAPAAAYNGIACLKLDLVAIAQRAKEPVLGRSGDDQASLPCEFEVFEASLQPKGGVLPRLGCYG